MERPLPIIPTQKTWHGQFRIAHIGARELAGTTKHALGSWQIATVQGAPTVPVQTSQGRHIGLLIGTAIDPQAGVLVDQPLRLDLPADLKARDAAIETTLYRLGGSWLCVLADGGFERIYLDADGTLSLVYDPQTRSAASSAGLLLDDATYRSRFDRALYTTLDVPGEGWFPSGLTAHRGIKRLLCNHTLDLTAFQAKRHWPVQDFAHNGSTDESAFKVAAIVRAQAEALLNRGKVVVALTGGNETRLLLAAYKPLIKDLTFVTVAAPSTTRDVVLATSLAERFGLRHVLLPLQEASQAEQDSWLYATGHCVTGPNMVSHPTIRPLAERYDYFLGGLGGEIGRAFFWRSTDTADMLLTVADLVPRFGMPQADAVTEATADWLWGVQHVNALTQLDLAYMELRMSAWSAAQTYAQSFVNHLHPLIAREIYALMLNLPPEAKRGNLLIKSAIAQSWPELGEIPINRYGDYRDLIHTAMSATDPKRVAKKLRKLFG
jgi:hypothetical protein